MLEVILKTTFDLPCFVYCGAQQTNGQTKPICTLFLLHHHCKHLVAAYKEEASSFLSVF
jgi:hypothetical protein